MRRLREKLRALSIGSLAGLAIGLLFSTLLGVDPRAVVFGVLAGVLASCLLMFLYDLTLHG